MGLMEKIHMLVCFAQELDMTLLAMSSMLVKQKYILNNVSLNRNTHKIRLYIID